MVKKLSFIILSLTLCLIGYAYSVSTIRYNEKTMERINYLITEVMPRRISTHLTLEEAKSINQRAVNELVELNHFKKSVSYCALIIILIFAIPIARSKFTLNKFDGLSLQFQTLLFLVAYLGLMNLLSSTFEYGNNATIDLRINIAIIGSILFPIICFAAFKLNKMEIKKKLHEQKWISILSLILCITSGLLTLSLGIGLLFTVDLSGNWG